MDSYTYLLAIAIILLSTKMFGLLSQRVHMPAVVGALVAGILLGPSCFGIVTESDFLIKTSEIGVIFLMFLAGLDTDLEELKKTGLASFVIAMIGVLVPLAGGTLCYHLFYNDPSDGMNMLRALFIGVVLTATSVSITVETLREMGRLRGRVGTAILGAAVIDDILGIIILTVITGFTDPSSRPSAVFIRIALFFVFIALVGLAMYHLFRKMNKVWGNKRRMAIVALSFCLILSYVAEEFFGIADITGAYFAGIMLCNISNFREYLAKKVNVVSYMFFSPVFFASIGIKTDLSGFNMQLAAFSAVILVVAIVSKIIGCGLGARLCRFTWKDSFVIGLGMVSRGEVALIVAQKGAQVGLIDSKLFSPIVLMVIVTTLVTPILLKLFMTPGQVDILEPEIRPLDPDS